MNLKSNLLFLNVNGLSIYFYANLGPVSNNLIITSTLLVTTISMDLAILGGYVISHL